MITVTIITAINTTRGIPMAETPLDSAALYRLMAWLSPSFPVGAFAYSHGLEWAVEDGTVADADGLARWLGDVLAFGGGRADAVLFRHAWIAAADGDADGLRDIADLALALAPGRERRMETAAQGRAFLGAARASWPWPGEPDATPYENADIAYPVAVAMAAAGHGVPLGPALHAYVHAFAANLISAGVRLVPLGQTDGQRVLARLEPAVRALADEAAAASLDHLGGAAFLADIAAMRHETQYTRLFRS